jgi:hypothetical protein
MSEKMPRRRRKSKMKLRKRVGGVAQSHSDIKPDSGLLECALARASVKDDFGRKLIARKGRVPGDIDLDF